MSTRDRSYALLLFLATLVLPLSLAAPAQAATGQLNNVSDGTLLARGTGVTLQVTFTCDPGAVGNAHINVLQRVQGGKIALAAAESPATECTGEAQTFSLTLQSFEQAFKKGTAQAVVTLTVCDASTCQQPTFSQEIKLVSK